MNEYGLSPFQMLQMMGPMLVVGPLLIWVVVMGPLFIYPIARWKQNREQTVDNQLGIKVALHFFRTIAFQVLLLGAVILVWTIISKNNNDKGEFVRAAMGFLVPAGVVFGVHTVFLKRTNDEMVPTVRRLFLGYNLIVTGLFGFTALVVGCQALFAKGSAGNEGRLFFASVFVYCGAWVACGIHFGRQVFGDFGSSVGGPPGNVVTPPAPQPNPAQPGGGPSLPPLSSGSFPPIEPKS